MGKPPHLAIRRIIRWPLVRVGLLICWLGVIGVFESQRADPLSMTSLETEWSLSVLGAGLYFVFVCLALTGREEPPRWPVLGFELLAAGVVSVTPALVWVTTFGTNIGTRMLGASGPGGAVQVLAVVWLAIVIRSGVRHRHVHNDPNNAPNQVDA